MTTPPLQTTTSPPPSKRLCLSPSPPPKAPLSIPSILALPESAVWSLRKSDLRSYFLALQSYALHPYPLSSTSSLPGTTITAPLLYDLPPLLRLPLEIRLHIYKACLEPPSPTPVRGPHPRQLQNPLALTQRFPPALLSLNRQVHSEAVPVFYGSPGQVVHIKIDYNVWVHKTQRSPLILSPLLTSSIKHVDLSIHLGSEKRVNRPKAEDAEARIMEVKKGVKKLRKWLAEAELGSLKIGWEEPAATFTWDVKKGVLDGLRGLRAEMVVKGCINWGLDWNKGKKYRFDIEYLKELERGRQIQGSGSSESLVYGI